MYVTFFRLYMWARESPILSGLFILIIVIFILLLPLFISGCGQPAMHASFN